LTTPSTSLVILLEILSSASYGILTQSEVIASTDSTTFTVTWQPTRLSSPSTPVTLSLPTYAKPCQTPSYNPSSFSTSSTISLTRLQMVSFSSLTSPMILTPRPGPGNGCLVRMVLGIPSRRPRVLTSSL